MTNELEKYLDPKVLSKITRLELQARLVAATRDLKMGDPKDEDTFIGPVISEGDGERLQRWIESAVAAGGRLLCGGGRDGAMVEATLIEQVPVDQPLCDNCAQEEGRVSGEKREPVKVLLVTVIDRKGDS